MLEHFLIHSVKFQVMLITALLLVATLARSTGFCCHGDVSTDASDVVSNNAFQDSIVEKNVPKTFATNNNNTVHVHYNSDQEQRENMMSNESKSVHEQNIDVALANKPVVYFETVFGTSDLPAKDKQIVNLFDMRGAKSKNDLKEKNPSTERIFDFSVTTVSRPSTNRLFKKHLQLQTTRPFVVKVDGIEVESTPIKEDNRLKKTHEDETRFSWEQHSITWETERTTELNNFSETRQLNLYRFHYNHFFWHPSKTTTFWLLVISGILLSFLITGLAAILYLCHRDHSVAKMELNNLNDDDDEDEDVLGVHHNQWSIDDGNSPLAMELSATSKTELLLCESDKSNDSSTSRQTNEANETSFDLKRCHATELPQHLISSRDEVPEMIERSRNFGDQSSGKSLVECNYYWSSSNE